MELKLCSFSAHQAIYHGMGAICVEEEAPNTGPQAITWCGVTAQKKFQLFNCFITSGTFFLFQTKVSHKLMMTAYSTTYY